MPINPFRTDPGTSSAISGSNFAPSVNQGDTPMIPAAGPWVRPMRNAAPGEMLQAGTATTGAGSDEQKIGNTIGDRVQETMDDANTKAAENQFLQGALPALAQYKTTQGDNAVQAWDPTAQAISKARQDARATLSNPIQQNMFDNATNVHMLSFGRMMNEHRSTQEVEYGKTQAQARAGSLNALSSLDVAGRNRPDSQFAQLGAASDNEVLHYAQLNGAAPDSPQTEEMLRQNRTNRYRSVITSLLDSHAYNEAGDFFGAHKDEMTLQGAEILGKAVKSATHAEQVTEYRNQAVQSVQKTPGAGPLAQPIPAGTISTTPGEDGLDIHAAPGTPVKSPGSGTVTKVWTDPQLGLSAQVALPNGYTATMSHLSAVNYTEGQKITQGQVLGTSGQDASRQGVMHYAMTDPDGQPVDPRQAVSAPFDPANFSDPNDEEKAVDWINQNVSDPVQQREAEAQVRSLASLNRQIENQKHSAAMKSATDYWFSHNQSLEGLPAETKMQLTDGDVLGFTEKSMEMYGLAQRDKDEKEVPLLANWIQNPASQTVDAVNQAYAQGRLSDSSYQTALRGAMRVQGPSTGSTDPQKVRAVSINHDQLTSILSLNNWPGLAQPTTPQDKLERATLETSILDEYDQQQQTLKRPLTWQEKGKIARDMVIDKVYTSNNSDLTPASILTQDQMPQAHVWIGNQQVRMADIPPQVSLRASQAIRARGGVPTQAAIAAAWLKAGRPMQ